VGRTKLFALGLIGPVGPCWIPFLKEPPQDMVMDDYLI